MFHKHNWGKWYFEDEVSATIRHCLKCGKREYRKDVISKVAPGNPPNGYATGGYVTPNKHFSHAHWAMGGDELLFYEKYDADVAKLVADARKQLADGKMRKGSETVELFQKYLKNKDS